MKKKKHVVRLNSCRCGMHTRRDMKLNSVQKKNVVRQNKSQQNSVQQKKLSCLKMMTAGNMKKKLHMLI